MWAESPPPRPPSGTRSANDRWPTHRGRARHLHPRLGRRGLATGLAVVVALNGILMAEAP
jgi:hypothetical protein